MVLRVVFAEDNYLVREGISALLTRVDGLDLVTSVGDLPSLMTAIDEHRPDVVLTDIRMPPTGTDEGLRAAHDIRCDFPGTGVVVLSQHAESDYAYDLLADNSEGVGYLLKERVSHVDELVRALEDTARGGIALDPKVVDLLLAKKRRQADSLLTRLSERETEVLALMAQGKNNMRIATELTVSRRSVEKHINAIFAKLGVTEVPVIHHRVKAVLIYLADKGLLVT